MSKNCYICSSKSNKIMEFEHANIYECLSCSFIFSSDLKYNFSEIFTNQYFTEHKNWFNNPDIELFSKIEKIIKVYKGKDSKILDIGCGNGQFLTFLKNKTYSDLTGIDLIDCKIPYIKTVCVDIFKYNIENKFDVIVSMMNIQHIININEYMAKLTELINKDGIIIINTINENALLYTISKILYSIGIKSFAQRLYSPHHVSHFSQNTLFLLAKKHGFKPLGSFSMNYPFKKLDILGNFAEKFFIYSGIFIINLFSKILNKNFSQTVIFKSLSG